MANFMKPIRDELNRYKHTLEDDLDEFNDKLNTVRHNLSDYIDQQIEYLTNIRNDINNDLHYLEEENNKTCQNNQQEFDRLCLTINQNDHDPTIVRRLLERFKQTFPLRPKMLKSIPEYHFKNIQIDDFIIKQNSSSNFSTPTVEKQLNYSFIPIDDESSSSLSTTSIDSSNHKQSVLKNNEKKISFQSPLVTPTENDDHIIDIIFQLDYEHNWKPHLLCYNDEQNYLLVYLFSSNQFQLLNVNSREFYPINYSVNESILNIGYSKQYHLYYYTTRQTNLFILFNLKEKDQEILIEIKEEIDLIEPKDHFITVHLVENYIYYLYLTSSSMVMLGKYDLDKSLKQSSIRIENRVYEFGEKLFYKILDFTINNQFIYFLIQFKNKTTSKILVYDCRTMRKHHSFDINDAYKPLSIISTKKQSNSKVVDDHDIESLLYINDRDRRLIHCCTGQQYLLKTRTSNFGMCTSDDGNLVLITEKDIRVLNFQDYIKKIKNN